jgi:hypothetical protein
MTGWTLPLNDDWTRGAKLVSRGKIIIPVMIEIRIVIITMKILLDVCVTGSASAGDCNVNSEPSVSLATAPLKVSELNLAGAMVLLK